MTYMFDIVMFMAKEPINKYETAKEKDNSQ